MADEMTTSGTDTTTGATSTASPAGGQTPAAASPTAEQQTAFQRFLGTLFGGKEEAPAAESKPTETSTATNQATPSTAYTEADVQTKLQEAKATWEAAQKEQARLEKLPPDERNKAEADARNQKVLELEAKLLQRDLKDTALASLQKDGFPAGLAEMLNYSDQASMEKSLQNAQEVFKAALEMAVRERLRGKTPEGLGGAANSENSLKDQIAKNIRGGLM